MSFSITLFSLCPALWTIWTASHNDFAEDRTNSVGLISVHFSSTSTHFISTQSSQTQFSLLALYVVHSRSLIFSLPEPCNLLTFSTPVSSVSLERPHIHSQPLFSQVLCIQLVFIFIYILPSLPSFLLSVLFQRKIFTLLLRGPIFLTFHNHQKKKKKKRQSAILKGRRWWWKRLGWLWGCRAIL